MNEPITTETIKPPLGVEPEEFWIMSRMEDLSRAIHEFIYSGRQPKKEWIEELLRRYEEL